LNRARAGSRRRWRPTIGLRFTLALAMLPLLAMPLIALRYAEVMTELARNERLENQAQAARNLAASLHERRELFEAEAGGQRPGVEPLPVELLADVAVDQDPGEWLEAPGRALPFRVPEGSPEGTPAPAPPVRLAAARAQERPGRFFLLVDADDERLVVPEQRDGVELPGDELIVEYGPAPDAMQTLRVQPVERPGGWLAEIGFDQEPALLRVRVTDVDYLGSRRVEGRADSGLLAPVRPIDARRRDERHAARWDEALRGLARASGRVSVYDAGGALLAQAGRVSSELAPAGDWQAGLARRLLSATRSLRPQRFVEEPGGSGDSTLTPLTRALSGVAAQQSERVALQAGLPVWLLTSAQPVWVGDRVAGALVLEESTGSRLGPGRAAIERLTLLTAAAMAASALALLAIGSITVARIVRLRRQAEQAIDARGRVVGTVDAPGVRDEIGALAESHARVLERLRQHQQYVGQLRARLMHELRTPIMVVRSSLDNLAAEDDAQRREAYLARVREGAQRLERLVASMGEASSLETMLAQSRLETTDLVALLGACAEGYRGAFAPRRFVVECEPRTASCPVVPEAIVQALDKLVSNAVDFAEPDTPVVLALRAAREGATGAAQWEIAVRNQGPPLPATMRENLFDSMVSIREHRAGADAHLGLGLYLVRLVAEFHGGRAFARDVAGGVEVGFLLARSA